MISLNQLRQQNLKWLLQKMLQANQQIVENQHAKKTQEHKKRVKIIKAMRRLIKKYHKRKRQQYRKHQEHHLLTQHSLFSKRNSEASKTHDKQHHLTCS